MRRVVIIGNSGSGKSTLARALAARTGLAATDLDTLHWTPAGEKRPEDEARAETRALAEAPAWIIEGVYGWLAAEALPRATQLVWLDLPWPECRANLLARGGEPGRFDALLEWAGAYATRQTSSSLAGHQRLVAGFAGPTAILRSRAEIQDWLLGVLTAPAAPAPGG